jgi:hypothetical protein
MKRTSKTLMAVHTDKMIRRSGPSPGDAVVSWKNLEALLGKVGVKAEDVLDSQPSHGLEAHAVDKAELPSGSYEKRMVSREVHAGVNPDDVQHRDDVVSKQAKAVHPDPLLKKRRGFHEHIVRGPKCSIRLQESFPFLARLLVHLVVGIKDGKKSRGIDKGRHFANASER